MGRSYTPPAFTPAVERFLRRVTKVAQGSPYRADPWQEGQAMYGKPVHGGLLRLLMPDDDSVREWLVDLCRIALKHADAAFLKALAETMILVKSPPPAGEKTKLAVWRAFPLAASKALKDKRGFSPDWTDILDVIQQHKLLPKKDTEDSDKMRREIQRSIAKLGYNQQPFDGISDKDAEQLPAPDDFDL